MEAINTRRLYQTSDRGTQTYFHSGYKCKAAWSLLKPIGVDARNFLHDPSFEGAGDEWVSQTALLGTTLTRTTAAAFDATYGLRVNAPTSATEYEVNRMANLGPPYPYPGFTALYDRKLYGSIWVRAAKGDTITVCFDYDGVFAGSINQFIRTCATIVADGTWQLAKFTVLTKFISGIMGAGIPVQVRIVNDNGSRTGQMDIDAGVVTFSGEVDTFFDGDTEGASWSGAPHASPSDASKFSRGIGTLINFYDLDLDLFSDEGWGHPDVEHVTSSFARLDGAHFQRTKFLPRNIRISFDVQTCATCNPTEKIHRIRRDLIAAIAYRFHRSCNAPMWLYYQPVKPCCTAYGCPVRIPVVYKGGLEAKRDSLYLEKITLEFTAYETVVWEELRRRSQILNINNAVAEFTVGGDDDAHPRIYLSAGSTAALTLNRIVNFVTETSINMGIPVDGYVIPVNNILIIDTNPLNFGATLIDGTGAQTNVSNQINFSTSIGLQNLRLVPGTNTMSFEGTGGDANSEITIQWKNRWLSADGAVDCDDK